MRTTISARIVGFALRRAEAPQLRQIVWIVKMRG